MIENHIYSAQDKQKHFGEGEWVNEPDEVRFEYRGIRCRINRIIIFEKTNRWFAGHLCGYICLPSTYPLSSNESYNDFDYLSIHGGITYVQKENDEFWIGFDCAHSDDLMPSMKEIFNDFTDVTYKNIKFVEEQCKYLVDQILEKMETINE